MKFLHVTRVEYLDAFRLALSFNDGASGVVDLKEELDGEVFEPLRDPKFFAKVSLEGYTIAWENGADFAPEFLREQLKVENLAELS